MRPLRLSPLRECPLPTRKFSGALPPLAVGLAPVAAALPMVAAAARAGTTRAGTWFWGDQALIDLEAHNSLVGRNLLGVYDRYGWHHLGPLWLAVLGVFRWLGGGSSVALVVGNDLVQAAAAAAIVVVATRLRPGLTGCWATLVLLAYEWSFGVERLGAVWAPYAIALPAALLVLLVGDIVTSPDPWPPTIGAAVCASFLCQTDISTVVVVGALVLVTPILRLAAGARLRRGANRGRSPSGLWAFQPGWGWATAKWRRYLAVLVVVLVVLWLPTVVQQLTTSPGNLVRVYHFLSKHQGHQPWAKALQAAGTIFGSFPLRLGEKLARRDSDPAWLVVQSLWQRPWFLAYLLVTVGAAVYGFVRRQRAAASLAAATSVAMLAAVWSVHLAYGPLYPYLVLWTGALVVPALTGWWLALAPGPRSDRQSARRSVRQSARRSDPRSGRPSNRLFAGRSGRPSAGPPERLVLPAVSLAAALAVSGAFGATSDPMAGSPSHLARRSWDAVAAAALRPGVHTVYVDIPNADGMPDAAAIADQAVRHGLRVELNRAALYFLDPSFAPTAAAQLEIVVCCGRKGQGRRPAGAEFQGRVGGERIYISTAGYRPPGRPVVTEVAGPPVVSTSAGARGGIRG